MINEIDEYSDEGAPEVAVSPAGLEKKRRVKNAERKRFILHSWQTAEKQSVRKARDEAAMKGRRVEQYGVIGAANFPVLNEDLSPKGAAQVIVSTSPVNLSDVKWAGGQSLEVEYRLLAEFPDFKAWVSVNVEEEETIEAVLHSACKSVEPRTQRTFAGKNVFMTFSTLGAWTLSGPSCGAAAFCAMNGYFPSVYLSGAIVEMNGILTAAPIEGLAQKIALMRGEGHTLVSPIDLDNVEEGVRAANGSYVSPLAATFGQIRLADGTMPTLIGVGDLGSLVTVAKTSEYAHKEARIRSEQSAPAKEDFDENVSVSDVDLLDPMVYSYREFTNETLRQKVQTWIDTNWPGSSSTTWREFTRTQAFVDELEESGLWEKVQQAIAKLGTPETRLAASIRNGGKGGEAAKTEKARINAWIAAAAQLGNKTKAEKGKKKKPAKPAVAMPTGKTRKANLVKWEDME